MQYFLRMNGLTLMKKDEVMYKNKDSTNYKRYKRTKER